MDAGPDTPPRLGSPVTGETDADARRRLCLAAMAGAPGLLRYAARFAPSLEDAEDAYQRGMEVALTKGPVGPPEEFLAWLHVVIRNEATTLARRRGRETPAGDDIVTAVDQRGSEAREPSAVAEWRDRYRTLQDAMTSLTEAERVCLLLRTAGVSRAEIGTMTGYTDRKVERSIVKARKRLHAWHLDLAKGERCVKLQEALERVADREADSRERKAVSKHVRHCGHCRATLRARRQTNAGITVLVPVALVGVGAAGLAVPGASPAVDIFDRSAARITVSVGQAWQTMLDLPSLLTARMGAGALAVTVAGVAGVPVVAKTVNGDRTATATVPARISTTAQATSTTGSTGLSPAQERAMAEIERIRAEADGRRRAAEARARAQRAEQRDAARRRAAEQRRAAQAAAAPAPASSSSTSSPQSTPAATPAAQPQLEFGP
jgi:RNA polymerase sigma factor (sigma-70 family)